MTSLIPRCTLAIALLSAATGFAQATKPAASVPLTPEQARADYQAIVSHLDTGGELLVVANTEGVLEDLVIVASSMARAIPQSGNDQKSGGLANAMDRLPAFLRASGLYAIDGFGMSVVPRADGLNDIKTFLYRDPAAAKSPFWQAFVGNAPRRLAALNYLPADTVLARAGTGDPRQFWKLLQDAVRQVGGPDAARQFDQAVTQAGLYVGTNLNDVIASLADEQFLALQLASSQQVQIPLPGNPDPLAIPAPALLLGCAVRDAALPEALLHALQQAQLPVTILTNATATLYTIALPMPLPVPLSPTFAVHRNMFLFGSTVEIVREAIAAAEAPAGTHIPAAIRQAFATLPMQNNGFAFVDPRFSETFAEVQTRIMQQAVGRGATAAATPWQTLLPRGQKGRMAAVILNEKDGVSIRGIGSENGRQFVLDVAATPLFLVSAIARPRLVRPPHMPDNQSCIDNLRLLDTAKQQWALENNKKGTDVPSARDLEKFFPNGRLPTCPQGGVYTIHAVDEAPTCSRPGHELPE